MTTNNYTTFAQLVAAAGRAFAEGDDDKAAVHLRDAEEVRRADLRRANVAEFDRAWEEK